MNKTTEQKTHDDVINEEIEQEHRESSEREKAKIFNEKMNNKNLLPIESTLTIKMVDFIDVTQLNEKTIAFKDYSNEKNKFIAENKKLNDSTINEIKEILKNKGLHILSTRSKGKKYCPFSSCMEDIRESFIETLTSKELNSENNN